MKVNHGLELTCACQRAHCSGLTTTHPGSAHTSRIYSGGAFTLGEEEDEEDGIKGSRHGGKNNSHGRSSSWSFPSQNLHLSKQILHSHYSKLETQRCSQHHSGEDWKEKLSVASYRAVQLFIVIVCSMIKISAGSAGFIPM